MPPLGLGLVEWIPAGIDPGRLGCGPAWESGRYQDPVEPSDTSHGLGVSSSLVRGQPKSPVNETKSSGKELFRTTWGAPIIGPGSMGSHWLFSRLRSYRRTALGPDGKVPGLLCWKIVRHNSTLSCQWQSCLANLLFLGPFLLRSAQRHTCLRV